MHIMKLHIKNFRGIKEGNIYFDMHTAIIGTNNSGKSTIIDSLAIALGRDRMVRQLTEHDFYGSTPSREQRINIVVSIIGFEKNDPSFHTDWFRDGRGVPKWWDPDLRDVVSVQTKESQLLCVEIGFSARFDFDTLSVESIRYFHDNDNTMDPFMSDMITRVPTKLLTELGFFLVPVSRTWDKLISFGSELFRRLVASSGGIPSEQLIQERDSLRSPSVPLESTGGLGEMIARVNNELARLLPRTPEIKLRITATDSESLLNSIVPHYQLTDGFLLPAGRNGTGLLSLQVLMLLLEFGRLRNQERDNFILAIEEPELHLPPGIQKRLIYRAHSVSTQTITTSHSPNVIAFYPATSVRFIDNIDGVVSARPLLDEPLQNDAPNGIRKLFLDNRQELITALMQEYILIPEGRIDYEWLRLLVQITETKESWDLTDEEIPFGTLFGVIPTHDAAIQDTFIKLSKIRKNLFILVDGDSDGDRYIADLISQDNPPSMIIQWPRNWVIEDVIIHILSSSQSAIAKVSDKLECEASIESVSGLLKQGRSGGGIKGNYLMYEDIASIIGNDIETLKRAKDILAEIVHLTKDPDTTSGFAIDGRSLEACPVRVWQP